MLSSRLYLFTLFCHRQLNFCLLLQLVIILMLITLYLFKVNYINLFFYKIIGILELKKIKLFLTSNDLCMIHSENPFFSFKFKTSFCSINYLFYSIINFIQNWKWEQQIVLVLWFSVKCKWRPELYLQLSLEKILRLDTSFFKYSYLVL